MENIKEKTKRKGNPKLLWAKIFLLDQLHICQANYSSPPVRFHPRAHACLSAESLTRGPIRQVCVRLLNSNFSSHRHVDSAYQPCGLPHPHWTMGPRCHLSPSSRDELGSSLVQPALQQTKRDLRRICYNALNRLTREL